MKNRLAVVCLLMSSLVLAPLAFAEDLAGILERGVLQVGVSEFAPWTFRNRNGDLEGFEIDVARNIAREMGVEPEFRVYVWDEIIGGLQRGEIDLIAAGMAITPSRALQVEFSSPYSESGTSIVINSNLVTADVTTIEDLNREGFVIAGVDATLAGDSAPQYFDLADIEIFVEPGEAEAALVEGRAHAYLLSVPEAANLVAQYSDRVAMPLTEPLLGSVAAFAVEPGNQSLLNYLNAWIAASSANGWLESTYEYWFGAAAWLSGVSEEE